MNKLILPLVVLGFMHIGHAMEITPPAMVLRQVIKNATAMNLPRELDIEKIRKANPNYTEKVVSALLLSLNTDDLEIQNPKNIIDLTVHVVAPRRVDFLFEARHSKWVDGADFTYYMIIGIEEKTSQQKGGRYSPPATRSSKPSP